MKKIMDRKPKGQNLFLCFLLLLLPLVLTFEHFFPTSENHHYQHNWIAPRNQNTLTEQKKMCSVIFGNVFGKFDNKDTVKA